MRACENGGGVSPVALELSYGENGGNAATAATPLTVSRSFKSSRRRALQRPPSLDADEFLNLLHGLDPVKVELNRLKNEIRGEEQKLIWTGLRMEKFRERERDEF
ncbi:hypothetical protein ACSBR2_026454 [Camellia fascicularis]